MPTLNKKEVIVVIDAWSGGKYLIPAFQSLGYFCLHIQSTFVPKLFAADNQLAIVRSDKHVEHDGNIERLLEILRPYAIKAILAGSEGAVSLADELNALCDLPFRNQTALSKARRDKFLMQEQLAANQIASIDQRLVSTPEELQQWLAHLDRWPVVLKPLQSAATDGVFVCHSTQQAYQAFVSIIEKKDFFGHPNQHVLCQEFLEGDEFVVNGVACKGNYFFTELWQSKKQLRNGAPVYQTQYLAYQDDDHFDVLTNYTAQVCQALGIENGAFHAEVMLTPRGPVLIEIGSRVAGGADPYIVEECLGHSQISKLVQAVIHPDAFLCELKKQPSFSEHKHAAYVYMISPTRAIVRRSPETQFIAIDGVISVSYRHVPGVIQSETVDLSSAPGVITVIREDKLLLDQTIAHIRAVEGEFYRTALTAIK